MATTDPQCTRRTRNGHRCRSHSADWGRPDPDHPVPNPVACWIHLTAEERAIAEQNRARPLPAWERQDESGVGGPPPRPPATPITAASPLVADQSPDKEPRPAPTSTLTRATRAALNNLAYQLAGQTQRHPAEANAELNQMMGVRRRDEATAQQLRSGLDYAQAQLDRLGAAAVHDAGQAGMWGAASRRVEIIAELSAIAAKQATLAADATVLLRELEDLPDEKASIPAPPF